MNFLDGVDYRRSFHIDDFQGNTKLLHCQCGYSPQTAGTIIGLLHSHKWALVVKCGACSKQWCVCVTCHRALKRFQAESQLNCHHRHYHRYSRKFADQKGHKKLDLWNSSHKSIVVEKNTRLQQRRANLNIMLRNPRKLDSHWIPIVRGDTLGFNSNNNGQKFFQFCIEQTNQEGSTEEAHMRNLGGLQYLLHKCQLGRDINPAISKDLFIPPEKVKLGISIAKLAYLHTSTNRGFLAETLHSVYKLGCEYGWYAAADSINKDFNDKYSPEHFPNNFIIEEMLPPFAMEKIKTGRNSVAVAIPTNANDIRNRYFDSIYSIAKNLPCPPIQEDIPGHAYRSIIDCARHFMAHLPSIGSVQTISFPIKGSNGTVSHTSQSKRAFQIFQNAMARNEECKHMNIKFVIGLTFWGDDVDPGSFCMQGRANMWIKTVTFGTPLDDANRADSTYPIAIGRKGECHDLVEARINKELALLRDPKTLGPFFVGCRNKMAHCYFEVEKQLGDQPERRGHTYFAQGNSHMGARYGVSANHLFLYNSNRLKSCDQCQKLLLERYQNEQWDLPIPSCPVCLNWDALLDTPLSLTPVPKEYPQVFDNDDNIIGIPDNRIVRREGQLYLKPFVVTFDTMQTAVDLAYDGYCNKQWSRANCVTFLQMEGFNGPIIERIILHNIRAHSLVVAVGGEKEELDQAAQANPAAFQKMPSPPSWVRPGSTIGDHVEGIMHELFHGGVNSVMELIQESLKRRGCNAPFIKLVQAQMGPLMDMSCDWLKLKMYKGGKFGGLICENYLAYTRIFPWLYQNYSESLPTGDPHKDKPPTNLSFQFEKWTIKNLAYWLRVRGLDTTGDKAALKYRVGLYLLGNLEKLPEVLPVPEISEEVIGSLVAATINFIGCAMSPQVTGSTIKKLKYAVRIFISAYDNLDSKLRLKKDKVSAVSRYNFPSMMNLPAMMESLGPLPFLWEGKNQGEGYLKKVKGTYYGGMMKNENWPVDMMKHISRTVEMDLLLPKQKEGKKVIQTESALNDRSRKFARVSCFDEVQSRIQECNRVKKKPVPVILLENGPEVHRTVRVFVVLAKMGEDSLVEIKRETNVEGGVLSKEKMGLVYHKFDIAHPGLKGELTWKSLLSLMISPGLGYGCLLPLLDKANDEGSRLFALISSTWTSLRPNNTMADLIVDDPYLRSTNI